MRQIKITKSEIKKMQTFMNKMPTSFKIYDVIFSIPYDKTSKWISIIHKISFIILFYIATLPVFVKYQTITGITLGIYFLLAFAYPFYYDKHGKVQLILRQIIFCIDYNITSKVAINETIKSFITYREYLQEKSEEPNKFIKTIGTTLITAITLFKFSEELKTFLYQSIKYFRHHLIALLAILIAIYFLRIGFVSFKKSQIAMVDDIIDILTYLKQNVYLKNKLNDKLIYNLSSPYPLLEKKLNSLKYYKNNKTTEKKTFANKLKNIKFIKIKH